MRLRAAKSAIFDDCLINERYANRPDVSTGARNLAVISGVLAFFSHLTSGFFCHSSRDVWAVHRPRYSPAHQFLQWRSWDFFPAAAKFGVWETEVPKAGDFMIIMYVILTTRYRHCANCALIILNHTLPTSNSSLVVISAHLSTEHTHTYHSRRQELRCRRTARVEQFTGYCLRQITSDGQFRQHPENAFIHGLEIATHCDS